MGSRGWGREQAGGEEVRATHSNGSHSQASFKCRKLSGDVRASDLASGFSESPPPPQAGCSPTSGRGKEACVRKQPGLSGWKRVPSICQARNQPSPVWESREGGEREGGV